MELRVQEMTMNQKLTMIGLRKLKIEIPLVYTIA